MRAQRPCDLAPAIIASAEALPLDDDAFDAAMAISSHHWRDPEAGLLPLTAYRYPRARCHLPGTVDPSPNASVAHLVVGRRRWRGIVRETFNYRFGAMKLVFGCSRPVDLRVQ